MASEIGPPDPEELDAAGAITAPRIAAGTEMGAVHLTVSELERSVTYYGQAVGLRVLERSPRSVRLGVGGRELLVLIEEPGARPSHGFTGLYHFALLLPQRRQLAGWLAHAVRDRVPLVGLSDHFVSEALYLSDPDGHGIEIYWDRPRETWEGQVAARMTTLPLDVDDLMHELDNPAGEPFHGLPDGTVMGHVHLKVDDVPRAVDCYRDGLGFALMAQLGRQAAFLAAGGYHHHIGLNSWESAGAGPPPRDTAALRRATIVLPDTTERDRVLAHWSALGHPIHDDGLDPVVLDPSGNALALAVR
jgi:catechol 2,3-dioxygenase